MVAKDDPLVRLNKVFAIVMNLARSGSAIIQHEDTRGDPLRIKSVANCVSAECRNEDVARANVFTSMKSKRGISPCASGSQQQPKQRGKFLNHDSVDD